MFFLRRRTGRTREDLKRGKGAQCKHSPKGDLESDVVLHGAAQIDARDVALQAPVRDEMDAVALGRLHTDDEEAEK